ncbi:Uncharacterised protein [Vibrio cholerae]|nr:Uncharacterised protein [Vibrio cholerae]CSI54449.1 Uncharacterised protein [Vibrio cholerae]
MNRNWRPTNAHPARFLQVVDEPEWHSNRHAKHYGH